MALPWPKTYAIRLKIVINVSSAFLVIKMKFDKEPKIKDKRMMDADESVRSRLLSRVDDKS